MRALWLEDGTLSVREDVPEVEPPPHEASVRVVRAGICNTDLELVRGYYPFTGVPGHEFVGIVEQGPTELVGRKVVGEINASCGRCSECRAANERHCAERTVLGIVGRHGAFAELLSLPARNLHPVPAAVGDDAATFVEPLAAALEIQEQIAIRPSDRVVVVGDGKLGQLVVQSLGLTGCDLTVVGRHPRKLALAESAGARPLGVGDSLEERRYDVAVECTGNAEGFEIARRALRPRGTLVLKSTYAGKLSVDAAALVVDEIRLIGSRCGPFAPAIRLLAEGLVEVEPLIDGRFSLEEGVAAFASAAEPGTLKILIEP